MIDGKAQQTDRIEWLPAERLGQWSVESRLRPWLIGKGLLTTRLKAACEQRFELRLTDQWTGLLGAEHKRYLPSDDHAGLFREVEMRCAGQVWVFAQSVMPDTTLSAYPWLAELGDCALGETLSELSGVQRSSYEYAWLPAVSPLAARALRDPRPQPQGLWARRSRICLRGAPILVQEIFLPAAGSI